MTSFASDVKIATSNYEIASLISIQNMMTHGKLHNPSSMQGAALENQITPDEDTGLECQNVGGE